MIIGVSGKIGSGKNEVADMLSFLLFRNINGTYHKFREAQDIRNTFLHFENYVEANRTLPNIHSFAENLKKCIAICTNKNLSELENRNVKSSKISWLGISYRELLQRLGECVRTSIDENFWVNSLITKYEIHENWIISDVRYLNEAETIKQLGGYLIRVNRNVTESSSHKSEIDLDNFNNFDIVIDNNKTLEELFNKVKNIANELYSQLVN